MSDQNESQEQRREAPSSVRSSARRCAVMQALAIIECVRLRVQYCFIEKCTGLVTTVVLLGGFLSDLRPRYFALVLLIVLVQQPLHNAVNIYVRSSLPSSRLIYNRSSFKEGLAYNISMRMRLLIAVAFTCCVAFLGEALYFFHLGRDYELRFRIVNSILWGLLTCNGALEEIAGFVYACSPLLFPHYDCDCSLWELKYYERLVQVGLAHGIGALRRTTPVEVAFGFMADELRYDAEPLQIYAAYHSMVRFVYYQKGGLKSALQALESDDPFLQQSSVHMLQFWLGHEKECGIRLCLEKSALQKLVELAVQAGSDQWSTQLAAVSCVQKLAEMYPWMMLRVGEPTKGGCKLVHAVVNRVEELLEHICNCEAPLIVGNASQILDIQLINLQEWLLHGCKTLLAILESDKAAADFKRSIGLDQIDSLRQKFAEALCNYGADESRSALNGCMQAVETRLAQRRPPMSTPSQEVESVHDWQYTNQREEASGNRATSETPQDATSSCPCLREDGRPTELPFIFDTLWIPGGLTLCLVLGHMSRFVHALEDWLHTWNPICFYMGLAEFGAIIIFIMALVVMLRFFKTRLPYFWRATSSSQVIDDDAHPNEFPFNLGIMWLTAGFSAISTLVIAFSEMIDWMEGSVHTKNPCYSFRMLLLLGFTTFSGHFLAYKTSSMKLQRSLVCCIYGIGSTTYLCPIFYLFIDYLQTCL